MIGKKVFIKPSIANSDYIGDIYINEVMQGMGGKIMTIRSNALNFGENVYHFAEDNDNWGWPVESFILLEEDKADFEPINTKEFAELIVSTGVSKYRLSVSYGLQLLFSKLINLPVSLIEPFIKSVFPYNYLEGFNYGIQSFSNAGTLVKTIFAEIDDKSIFKKGFLDGVETMQQAFPKID